VTVLPWTTNTLREEPAEQRQQPGGVEEWSLVDMLELSQPFRNIINILKPDIDFIY
jgi:hypothetical protein